jgi:hypothetical protein
MDRQLHVITEDMRADVGTKALNLTVGDMVKAAEILEPPPDQ